MLSTYRSNLVKYFKHETDLEVVRAWVRSQPQFADLDLLDDPDVLAIFLAYSDGNVSLCKQKITNFQRLPNEMPEFYSGVCHPFSMDMKLFRRDCVNILVLPALVPDRLYRITVIKRMPNLKSYPDPTKYLAAFIHLSNLRLHQRYFTDGECFIFDLSHASVVDLVKFTPSMIKKCNAYFEKVFSSKVKQIHFVHAPLFMKMILDLCKSTFKPKMLDRMFVHHSFEGLAKFFPKHVLPLNFGGTAPCLEEITELQERQYEQSKKFFQALLKQ